MGGGHSINSTTSSLVNVVSNTINTTLQKAQTNVDQKQTIEVKCNASEILEKTNRCMNVALGFTVFSDGTSTPPVGYVIPTKSQSDTIRSLCDYSSLCKVSNISMNQVMNATITSQQMSTFKSTIKNNLKAELTKNITQKTGLLEFNDTVNSKLESTVNVVTNLINSVDFKIEDIFSQLQGIKLETAGASYVSMSQSSAVFEKRIQSNVATMAAINDLSVAVTETITQTSTNVGIGLGILGGLVALILLVYFVKWLLGFFRRRRNVVLVAA